MRPSAARNGRRATSEYILYDANAGYQQTPLSVVTRPAKKTGLRSHRHHQHRRAGGSEPMERHETPDAVRSSAVKPRIQCVRVRAQARAHSRADRSQLAPAPGQLALLRLARVCSGQLAGGPCVRSRVLARVYCRVCYRVRTGAGPGGTPGSVQARRPRQQRSLGSERGLATPSPDGKGEISLGPSVTIMPVDSYSTLGRSCEPAFKWIPDPGRARIRARAARQRQTLAGGWSALGGHEVSCSFTWPGSSPEIQPGQIPGLIR